MAQPESEPAARPSFGRGSFNPNGNNFVYTNASGSCPNARPCCAAPGMQMREGQVHPASYYETFMRYESSDEVFVAMPFSKAFAHVFDTIVAKAIRAVRIRGKPMEPRVINRGTTGAPDIHEKIFDAIVHSRLVIADMTVQGSCLGDDGKTRWQANPNVAYEVGLACAWRNPEDVLLIHQTCGDHSYSFDVQNLRHFEYDPAESKCVELLAAEIVNAINQSKFIAHAHYERVLHSMSPNAIQLMHSETARAFPIVSFESAAFGVSDSRVDALTELLRCRALRNRNVIRQGGGKGVAVIYQWTALGLRMLLNFHAATKERVEEMREQIASVPADKLPPQSLLLLPDTAQPIEAGGRSNPGKPDTTTPQ